MLALTHLCTILEPAAPSGDIDIWRFLSKSFDDSAFADDLELTQSLFEAAGEPYTVQFCPAAVPTGYDDWGTECLTAFERSPSLSR